MRTSSTGPLREVCGNSLTADVGRWLDSQDTALQRTASIGTKTLQVLGHRTPQGIILEFEEPPATQGETIGALYPRSGRFMDQLQDLPGIEEACAAAASEFRRISGFHGMIVGARYACMLFQHSLARFSPQKAVAQVH